MQQPCDQLGRVIFPGLRAYLIFKGSSLSLCLTDFGKYNLFHHIQL